jgi:hypothetical protein
VPAIFPILGVIALIYFIGRTPTPAPPPPPAPVVVTVTPPPTDSGVLVLLALALVTAGALGWLLAREHVRRHRAEDQARAYLAAPSRAVPTVSVPYLPTHRPIQPERLLPRDQHRN